MPLSIELSGHNPRVSRTRGHGEPFEGGKRPSTTFVLSQVLTRWTLLALIVVVPIIVMPGFTYDVFNIPKFGVLVIGTSIALALHVFGLIRGFAPPIPRAAWAVPLAIFVPLLISWVFSPYQEWALFGQYSRLQGLIPYGLFGVLSVLTAGTFLGRTRQLAWALAVAGSLVALGLILGMVGISAVSIANQAGTLGNSNYVGGFLAITLPLALHLWLTQPGRSYSAMMATTLMAAGLILSYSQGGQMAAVAGVAVVVGTYLSRPWTRRLSLALAAGIALVAVGMVAVNFVRPVGGFTATTRSNMWRSALAMGADSPVIGSGPNTFAIEGPRYRSLEDSLNASGFVGGYSPVGIENQTSDDPHSVPLSFYANAGLIGLAGLLIGWGWVIRRGLRFATAGGIESAFFAGTIAYFVQGLISIDELTIRLGFWVGVAGLVAATAREAGNKRQIRGQLPLRLGGAAVVGLLLAFAGTWYGLAFIRADHEVRRGVVLFSSGDGSGGAAEIRSALAFRDETLYREVLAGLLGLEALEAGKAGTHLIEEMREINTYLDELPDVGAIHAYARLMNYWGYFDESGYEAALALYRRAGRLDPVNPLIKIETAEVLVDLDRSGEALLVLERLLEPLQGRMAGYWAALSVVRSELGDLDLARDALTKGRELDPNNCRVMLADALLAAEAGAKDPPTNPLNLRLNCDPGLYNMLLRRLPQDARSDYT